MSSAVKATKSKGSRSQTPLVSIIVLGHNGERYLQDCFASLATLHWPRERLEIIYADNASSDGSLCISEKWKNVFDQFRVLRFEANYGYAGGNNRAAAAGRGDILVFFNQDAVADSWWLDRVVAQFADPKVGAVGSRIVRVKSGTLFSGGVGVLPGGFCYNYLSRPGPCDAVSGSALAVRRDAFFRLGGFDERFFMYYEDIDLCLRLHRMGLQVVYSPEAIVWHNVEDRRVRASPGMVYYAQRNRPLFVKKHSRFPRASLILDVCVFFPLSVIYEFLRTPKSARYFNEIINARVDSIRLWRGF